MEHSSEGQDHPDTNLCIDHVTNGQMTDLSNISLHQRTHFLATSPHWSALELKSS